MNDNLIGIVIDPGHGGDDSGARGNNQLEKDFTLKISKYMYDRFKELGIPVVITRETDETLTPDERVKKILSAYGDSPNVIVISNHLNAGGGTGAEVIYALRNNSTLADTILNNIGQTGQSKRRIYQRKLPTDPTKDYYFIHRNTGITEPLIIEYGFIDGTKKEIDFLNNNYKELAEAVIKAIASYKNIPYTEPNNIINNTTYIIKKGDTLYTIANKYNTTIDRLKELNNLTSNTLSIGQVLKIPSINLNNTYTVKKGDYLYSIAKKYNTTVDEIKRLNNLINNDLTIGQTLILPSNNIIEEIITPEENYIVKSGDTIYSIARSNNTTIDEIKRLNNLSSNLISVGQSLILPAESTTNTYIVEKGDNLYSIANKFNTTIDKLKNINNLKTNTLSIGQELLINKS